MKTEDLIAELAGSAGPSELRAPGRSAVLAVAAGAVVSAAIFFLGYGIRPAAGAALAEPVILAKTLLPLLLGCLALALAVRSARPGAGYGLPGRAIWIVPLAALALFALAFVSTAAGERLTLFIGHSIPVCLPSITLLALPMAGLLMAALRDGAPEHPVRCGAFAGLAAAGFATALYSLFCTEDSPLFYSVWYSLGIGIAAAIAGAAGARFLRW